jgi:hypothetical protein
MIWSIPVVALASTLAGWLVVRAGDAPAAPPLAVTTSTVAAPSESEIGDPSLRAHIRRLAESARAQTAR